MFQRNVTVLYDEIHLQTMIEINFMYEQTKSLTPSRKWLRYDTPSC